MPIYEYQCTDCAHSLEAIQKISAPVLTECPACKKQTLKKCVTAPAFRLSGSGWYETDFKTGSKKNLAGDKSDSGTTSKSADAKSKPSASSADSA